MRGRLDPPRVALGPASTRLRRCLALAVLASWVPLVASDYLTEGNDPDRTGWMKDEKVFTLANVKDFSPEIRSLGNAIVGARLDENQQLQLVDYFAPKNANWMRARDLDMNVTPMAFDYRGRKFLVGTSKECRVWLLDREALGGEDHRTPLAWISQNIVAPVTPIVVNGVAFAASGPRTGAPAALYALHGASGKPLWNSEKIITSPLSGRSFWVGSGHVFVGTRDGTVYAFGFAMERK